MVVVPKADGKVRMCVDLTKLNESILREYHPLPNIDHTFAQPAGATIFSKLDALSLESAKLTTFITPFGRFCFNRLPFGISSAPEHFQKRISQVLEESDGAICLMGDILVYGSSVEDHNQHLEATLHNLQEASLKWREILILKIVSWVSGDAHQHWGSARKPQESWSYFEDESALRLDGIKKISWHG